MEMREKIEISGVGNGPITLVLEDGDDTIELNMSDSAGSIDTVIDLAEARQLHATLGLMIKAAEHNATDWGNGE
jgi:hypothetical protein